MIEEPGYDVSDIDEVRVDGKIVKKAKFSYYILNKPIGYVTTTSDEKGRPTVLDLVPSDEKRLFPVGRLDINTSGLLLITNDGELTNKLIHPSSEFKKTYRVRVHGIVTIAKIKWLEKGVDIGGYVTAPANAKIIKHDRNSTVVDIVIHEGKNRQVRRMFKTIGHPVQTLERIGYGNIRIGRLATGNFRKLSHEEIEYLKKF